MPYIPLAAASSSNASPPLNITQYDSSHPNPSSLCFHHPATLGNVHSMVIHAEFSALPHCRTCHWLRLQVRLLTLNNAGGPQAKTQGQDGPLIWNYQSGVRMVTPKFMAHIYGAVCFAGWLRSGDTYRLLFTTVDGWIVCWQLANVSDEIALIHQTIHLR